MNTNSAILALLLGIILQTPCLSGETKNFRYLDSPARSMTVYYPDDWVAGDERSALVIFRCNIAPQREHFLARGMVVIKPHIAPVNSGNLPGLSLEEINALPKPRDQVMDCKSAIRYIRTHAERLGVHPEKIVATGTSGGGDLALLTTLNQTFEHPTDDSSVSAQPDALVLYSPAFDGIDIWFVTSAAILSRTKAEAAVFLPELDSFFTNMDTGYVQPLDHRAALIAKAAKIGEQKAFDKDEVAAFQDILGLLNKRDWQLLHPAEDALQMSASRILTRNPLPPTIILLGNRDHLRKHQSAFVKHARGLDQIFELKEYEDGGHSFMNQPAFESDSTDEVDDFLVRNQLLPPPLKDQE